MAEEEVQRTWDGQEIAADRPMGSAVVVRRATGSSAPEVLVLHRAALGPDFEGDWAWTAPTGCRLPGEAVYPAALRELAEEAGLDGLAPWAVDLSGRWSVFAVDVPAGTQVDLVDPEHDAYVWLPPERAAARIRPEFVGAQQAAAMAVPALDLHFRLMADADCATVAGWHRAPHVREWWDGLSLDEESVRRRYGPAMQGADPTRMWIVEVDDRPAGVVQDYRVRDYADYAATTGDPDAVAFDYLIGDASLAGRGLGTRMIWEFCRDVLRRDYPDAVHFLASPSHRNARSLRVLAKCGFTAGRSIEDPGGPEEPPDTEIVCTLDVRHWLG